MRSSWLYLAVRSPRARLDLAGVGRDHQIGDGAVLCLARTVTDHCRVPGAVSQLDGVERLGERADLVELDEHAVRDPALDAHLDAVDVGDEQVVADELNAVAHHLGDRRPAFPIFLRHPIFNGYYRIFICQAHIIIYHFFRSKNLAFSC